MREGGREQAREKEREMNIRTLIRKCNMNGYTDNFSAVLVHWSPLPRLLTLSQASSIHRTVCSRPTVSNSSSTTSSDTTVLKVTRKKSCSVVCFCSDGGEGHERERERISERVREGEKFVFFLIFLLQSAKGLELGSHRK